MATLVLTAVGSAIGGPIGSAVGSIIGQQIDQAIFGGGSREGPRLKELSVTTSSYGQPIPRHFGRMRVAGSVIWSTELQESSKKEGGGKGKPSVKTYSYSASFAVALSSTPIARVGRIWADGNLLRGANDDLKVGGEMRAYLGNGDHPVDPVIAADRGADAPAFRDSAYVVFEDLQLADFGNRIPALTFEVFAPNDASVSLSQIVPQSTETSSDILLRNARGYSDEGGAVGAALTAIERVFPLACATTGKGLSFASEEALPASIPVLPEQQSPNKGEDAQTRQQMRGAGLGSEPLALRYYDEQRDYQPGVQRALGRRPDGRESMIDLPAAMTASGARELANSNAHRARWNDERVTWRVAELDPDVRAGSVVRLPNANGFWRVRSWEWFDRGVELGLQRLPPPLDAVFASDAGTANTPLDLAATQTLIDAIEVPLGGGSNPNNPTLLLAATSSGPGWHGASVYVEQGSTLAEIGSTGSRRATSGILSEALGPSASALFEPSASVTVDLPAQDLGFTGTDISGIAMGENRLLVGGEVLQFLHADRTGPVSWKLTGLLRGRAGTEDAAMLGHAIGTSVVRLDESVEPLDPEQVPSSSTTRIAAIGQADSEPVYANLRNAGLSRRPPMPVGARKIERADESWDLCWIRRARGQWRWPETGGVPLVEEDEEYIVGFGPTDNPHAAWITSTPTISFSASDRANLLAAHGAGPLWVCQDGTYGQSAKLLLAQLS